MSVSDRLEGKRIVICAGSGGVGKTTTSAAIAMGPTIGQWPACVATARLERVGLRSAYAEIGSACPKAVGTRSIVVVRLNGPVPTVSFDATVTLRLDARAPDGVLDAIAGTGGATADRRLTGVAAARGSSAVDGDTSTAWTTPFGAAVGSTLTVALAEGASVDHFTIVQPTDGLHATITRLSYRNAAGEALIEVAPPDAAGRSSVVLPTTRAPKVTGRRLRWRRVCQKTPAHSTSSAPRTQR